MTDRFLSSVSLLCLVLAWTGMRGIAALAEGIDTTPKILTIDPTSTTVSSQGQHLKFTGSNLQDVASVVLADPAGKPADAKIESSDATHLAVLATLGTAGKWKLTATNKAKQTSEPFEISVAEASSVPAPKTGSTSVPIPKILAIVPAAPLILPNQPLVLTGSDFKDGVTVTFTDAANNSYSGDVQTPIKPDRLVVVATLGIAGKWTVTATNKGGDKSSDPYSFAVANGPRPIYRSPEFFAFVLCVSVSTVLLGATITFVLIKINAAQAGGWSLTEALSEESIFQPKVITQKSDVITYASTSRVIALIGLMGILSIVVGVGYTIIWNLTIFGTVPDLSQVRSYLYGAALLFAPYLANQLSSAFTPSAKPQSADNPASTAVTGVAPATPMANPAAQPLRITGSGFQPGLNLSLTDPQNAAHAVAAADITDVAPTLVTANLTLNTPGSWKVVVANPAATPMAPFGLSVLGPPTVNAANPAAAPGLVTHDAANPQKIIFGGSGFVSGLTVQLSPPGGGVALSPSAVSITSQQVTVAALLSVPGNWQAVITNPGNQPSVPFTFPVA